MILKASVSCEVYRVSLFQLVFLGCSKIYSWNDLKSIILTLSLPLKVFPFGKFAHPNWKKEKKKYFSDFLFLHYHFPDPKIVFGGNQVQSISIEQEVSARVTPPVPATTSLVQSLLNVNYFLVFSHKPRHYSRYTTAKWSIAKVYLTYTIFLAFSANPRLSTRFTTTSRSLAKL